ncbi:DUF1428 domain-containing protein [Sneathiella chinensis]|uniref:DUF1428 domain-containing protein n=1 Tax=Sneathiella chinensis TaxID=349750 RepID=A0ABQ5U415_9PROT|nr:DUF1428 domain-containing protein [Sneathiella chinensis]GLQ06481.1 hypothetical protein GCM10007924_17020 [Sneathiella chinensis]
MPHFIGCVAAIPIKNKDAYRQHTDSLAPYFKEIGTNYLLEYWENDIPDGKITDFRRSVLAQAGEAIVFSLLEFPDKATADSSYQKMAENEEVRRLETEMPFDGKRMIFGGFTPLTEAPTALDAGYMDVSLLAVPFSNRDAYEQQARHAARIFKEHGALQVAEAWGDSLPNGTLTDFFRAVQATEQENVALSWVQWPSKKARDEGWQKIWADPRMEQIGASSLYDHQRRVFGGFTPFTIPERHSSISKIQHRFGPAGLYPDIQAG